MGTAAPYDARQIANFTLDACERLETGVSALKLLKILYFSYGWYLLVNGTRLFHNPIEAWEHGPVVRAVWDEFKRTRGHAIQSRATFLDLGTGERRVAPASLEANDADFVLGITRENLAVGAWALSERTHERGTAWEHTWSQAARRANLGMRITDELISKEFTTRGGGSILR